MRGRLSAVGHSPGEASARTTVLTRSVAAQRRAPLGWSLWLGLLLLALVGLIDILLIRYVGDLADKRGVEVINDRMGGSTERGASYTIEGGALGDRSRLLLPRADGMKTSTRRNVAL
ncbi:MAG: hypothetical protein LC799_00075 [Actinobacteria bacterium]|nr:hypothetical protein [Actinomycetota bacterium]